jgi:hypothetical protein
MCCSSGCCLHFKRTCQSLSFELPNFFVVQQKVTRSFAFHHFLRPGACIVTEIISVFASIFAQRGCYISLRGALSMGTPKRFWTHIFLCSLLFLSTLHVSEGNRETRSRWFRDLSARNPPSCVLLQSTRDFGPC